MTVFRQQTWRPFVMRRRVLILPLAAALIAGLVIYRMQRPPGDSAGPSAAVPAERRLVPRFALYDQQGQLVKFERYLGRTRMIVVFFDGGGGADADPHLTQLGDHITEVQNAGVQVIGISTATRYANEQAASRGGQPFPFPLLTDIDPQQPIPAPVHQQFGLYDLASGTTRRGVFLIDRAGMVAWENGHPQPVAEPDRLVALICRGQWPLGVP
jgi:peroxiredoxin